MSTSLNTPAQVEIINFKSIISGTTVDMKIINIMNPTIATPTIEFSVNV